MLEISPADIVSRLRLFLYLRCGLFGCMHLGAWMAWQRDARDARSSLRELLSARCGFVRRGEESAWCWSLEQDEIAGEVYRVQGTVVAATKVFGLPLARLRSAVPEETLRIVASPHPGARSSLGRRAMSALGLIRSLPQASWVEILKPQSFSKPAE